MNRWPLLLIVALVAACTPTTTPSGPPPALVTLSSGTPEAPAPSPTLTLAPLAAASPSPTPILYTVKPGDTLIGIAARFHVTVAAIVALNPAVEPQALQIGQTLVMPPPGIGGTPGGIPTPTPLALTTSPVACYVTPVGSVWCLGEVRNPLAEAVSGVVVQITLPPADGSPGETQVASPPLNIVPPGGAAPFGALFAGPHGGAPAAAAILIAAEPAGELAGRYGSLTVPQSSSAAGPTGYTVSGTLTNAGESAVSDTTVVVTVYNAVGLVNGFKTERIQGVIAAGDSVPFAVAVTSLAGSVEGFAVAAEGAKP